MLILAALLLITGMGRAMANTVPPAALPTLWAVPPFSFLDQDGQRFTDRELRGHVWIADYIYTQCTTACPMLTAHLRLLQRKTAGHDVRFLSFSVDPAHDTPAALKAYAAKWNGDEARWRLLSTGTDAALHALITGMRTELTPSTSPEMPIMHSELFVLIDGAGQVRGRYDSTDPDALSKLAVDAQALADAGSHASAPTSRPAASGRELYMSFGCGACHGVAQVAPPLEGLAGSQVKLVGGWTVKADDAYLRSSILEPSKDQVAGYPPTMPSYQGHLTAQELDALVGYLGSLKALGAGTTEARTAATDPVCGMRVSAGKGTPSLERGGKTFYFCSDACRQRFEKQPAK